MTNSITNNTVPKKLVPLEFPLNANSLIEASAGTGKTFTIAFLYVRLILGHGQIEGSQLAKGLLPKEILVVTFTEAATKELVDRIRHNIALASEVFSKQGINPNNPDAGLLIALKNSYPEAQWPACQKKLIDALELMDEAAISTIHAWCNRMLSEHAFDSGSLFHKDLLTDQQAIIEQAVKDYWRLFVYPLSGDKLEYAMSIWSSPQQLLQSVIGSLHQTQYFQTVDSIDDAWQQVQSLSHEIRQQDWVIMLDQAKEFAEVTSVHMKLKANQVKNPILKVLDDLQAWLSGTGHLPDKLSSLTGYKKLSTKGFNELVSNEVPTLSVCACIDKFHLLKQQMSDLKLVFLQNASEAIAKSVQAELEKRAEMGFNDLLEHLNRALYVNKNDVSKTAELNTKLINTIAKQFPVALIDEFQDTDPIQFSVFEKLYLQKNNLQDSQQGTQQEHHHESCLLMIGDPKQAIYSFRGGDIYTYLQASMAVDDKYTLGTNYRSTHSMVNAVNHVFAQKEQLSGDAFGFLFQGKNPMPFSPVEANGLSSQFKVQGETVNGLTFWVKEEEKLSAPDWRSSMAQACATKIVELLNLSAKHKAGFVSTHDQSLKALLPSDIAILVNKRSEANMVKQALLERNLNSVFLSVKGSVLNTQEARDILYWLRAAAEPSRISLIRSALGTATLNKSFHELHQVITDEAYLDALVEQFRQYKILWQTKGVLPMLRKIMVDFKVQHELLKMPNGERILTDLLHIGEVLQKASLKVDGLLNLLHYYENLVLGAEAGNDDFHLPRLESDSSLIKIVTIHKSKGLQYPLVFLPFATQGIYINPLNAFYAYHDDDGNIQTSFSYAQAKQKLSQEQGQEEIRKLYVALTRAKYATWVGAANNPGWEQSGLSHLLSIDSKTSSICSALSALINNSDNADTHTNITAVNLPDPSEQQYIATDQAALSPARIAKRDVKQVWNIHSYSSISYLHHTIDYSNADSAELVSNLDEKRQEQLKDNLERLPQVVDDNTEVEFEKNLHTFPKGANPGTFLHNILEWCAHQGFAAVHTDNTLLNQHIHEQAISAGWEDYTAVLLDWIPQLLARPIVLQSNTAVSAPLCALQTLIPEMEFWFTSHQAQIQAIDNIVIAHTFSGVERPPAEAKHMTGIFKGFIDLTFEHENQYYVLDYKSNYLGENDEAYTAANIEAAILSHRYDLQFVIYILALHRLLKQRLPDYDYNKHVGGAVYYFLRGVHAPSGGIFTTKPPLALIEEVDRMFANKTLVPEGDL